MVIKVSDQVSYARKWVQFLGVEYGFFPRELQVAQEMVIKYMVLSKAKSKLVGKAKEEFKPITVLKSKDSLTDMCNNLRMPFPIFKEYLRKLKQKGFFADGDINPVFIPGEKKSVITVEWT